MAHLSVDVNYKLVLWNASWYENFPGSNRLTDFVTDERPCINNLQKFEVLQLCRDCGARHKAVRSLQNAGKLEVYYLIQLWIAPLMEFNSNTVEVGTLVIILPRVNINFLNFNRLIISMMLLSYKKNLTKSTNKCK